MLQIGHKSKKWQRRQNLLAWRHRQIFWRCFISLAKFSYCSKFHLNVITGPGVMTLFFYKGLTRKPEIRNTSAWVLPNIWRLGKVKDTKFGTNFYNEMLLNSAKCQCSSFYRFWFNKGKANRMCKIVPLPRLGLKTPLKSMYNKRLKFLKKMNMLNSKIMRQK